jgi:hypothetical protein
LCYDAGAVPDPGPALWLRPETLVGYANLDAVFRWPDSSGFGRDGSNLGPSGQPLYLLPAFGPTAVIYSPILAHTLATPLPVQPDLSLLAVAVIRPQIGFRGAGFGAAVPGGRGLLQVTRTSLALCGPGGPVFTATLAADPTVQVHVFAVRVVSGVCHLRLDGVEIGAGVIAWPALPAQVNVPATTISGINPGSVALTELVVYDQPLSDAGFAAEESRLIGAYLP